MRTCSCRTRRITFNGSFMAAEASVSSKQRHARKGASLSTAAKHNRRCVRGKI